MAVGLVVATMAFVSRQSGDAVSDQSDPTAVGTSAAPRVTPSPEPGSREGFPGPSDTGVPEGTPLSPYVGPCTIIEKETVIDSSDVQCDKLEVRAKGVRITKSKLRVIDVAVDASLVLEDSLIDSGSWIGPTVGYHNITMRRADVRGGQHSVVCDLNCLIEDSWLHGQSLPEGEARHNNAYLSNGGSNVVLRHNTLACEPKRNAADGGCSGDASIFGDFSSNRNYTFDANLFVANATGVAWCLFAGHDPGKPFGSDPTGIVVTNNVFERGTNGKCGAYGAATSFLSTGAGNVWTGNRWDDGSPVMP